MKTEEEVKEVREHIYTARSMSENSEYLRYLEGVIDTLNYILEV